MIKNQKIEAVDVNMFPAASNSEDVLSYVNPAGSEYPVICYNNVKVPIPDVNDDGFSFLNPSQQIIP